MKIVEQMGSFYFKRSLLEKNYSIWLEFGTISLKTFKSMDITEHPYLLPGIKQPKTLAGKIKWTLLLTFKQCRWGMTYSIAPSPEDIDDIRWLRRLGNDPR